MILGSANCLVRRGLGRRRSEGLVVDVLGILPGALHVPALEYLGASFDAAVQHLVSVKAPHGNRVRMARAGAGTYHSWLEGA